MPFPVLPGVPQARKSEGATTAQLKGIRLLWCLPFFRVEFINPDTGTRQRRFLNGSRQVGALVIVSERALIVDRPLMSFRSFVKNGTRPQRASGLRPLRLLRPQGIQQGPKHRGQSEPAPTETGDSTERG